MGKLSRGALWLWFWPAGLLASRRHGEKKRHAEILDRIDTAANSPAEDPNPGALLELRTRLRAAGVTRLQDQRPLLRDAMILVRQGDSPEAAVQAVLVAREAKARGVA